MIKDLFGPRRCCVTAPEGEAVSGISALCMVDRLGLHGGNSRVRFYMDNLGVGGARAGRGRRHLIRVGRLLAETLSLTASAG